MVAIKELSGTITKVDVEESILVIAPIAEDEKTPEDVKLYVNKETEIEKNGVSAKLPEIIVRDDIDASYLTDQTGKNVAIQIEVPNGD